MEIVKIDSQKERQHEKYTPDYSGNEFQGNKKRLQKAYQQKHVRHPITEPSVTRNT